MTLDEQYQAAYQRATRALKAIDEAVHDMPAPESGGVTWGTLADMQRIMTDLEQITRYTR